MARQYKVRLGDGTLLAVDLVGLRAWLYDDKARVQRVGSRRWRTLKEMIEAETAKAAADAARPRPSESPAPKPAPKPEPAPPSHDSVSRADDVVAQPGHNVPILPPEGLEEEGIAAAAEPAEEEIPIPAEEEEFAIPPDEEVAIPMESTELPALARSAPVEPLAAVVAEPVVPAASKPPVAIPKPVVPAARGPVAAPKRPVAGTKPPVAV